MKDKLPKIFKSNIDNMKTRVQQTFYYHPEENKKENFDDQDESILLKKINEILNSKNYIYNADITILHKNGESIDKKIIGYKDGYLLFLDGSKMSISDVHDIK